MNNQTREIYRRFTEMMKTRGYINLNHRLVNSKDDLAEIASIFRDTRYETFRIIYMKKNRIVGYESISSRTPNFVILDNRTFYKNGRQKSEMCFYKVLDRMNRLGADGYYLVHNHPSDNAVASKEDIKTTETYARKVNGFKGHLIVNHESYAWISVDDFGMGIAENKLPINKLKKNRMERELKSKSIYDVTINSRSDLVSLISIIKDSPNYSIAILTDAQGKTRLIMDIPNKFLNMDTKQVKGYFQNLARNSGSVRVFFATKDDETFEKAISHQKHGTFRDVMCYKDVEGRLLIKEPSPMKIDEDLFDEYVKNKVCEDSAEYKTTEDLEDELLEHPKQKQVIILYKKVGEKPVPMKIDNTLEAKQKLVGGLIEVVDFDDILLVCNEEGKLLNLRPNLAFPYDYIAGDCFLIGDDFEHGEFKSLTKDEVIKYYDVLEKHAYKYQDKEDSSKLSKSRAKDIKKLWEEFFEETDRESQTKL